MRGRATPCGRRRPRSVGRVTSTAPDDPRAPARSPASIATARPADGFVLVRDVGPRDGLQAIDEDVGFETKVAMVEGLVGAGVPRVEVGSFVSPRAVPRMADSGRVVAATSTVAASRESLVVNERGARDAVAAGADVLVGVVAASDTFSHRNVGTSTDDALAELGRIAAVAHGHGVPLSVDLATAFGCAFEGRVAVGAVARVAEAIVEAGAFEVVLSDTIGAAAPNDVTEVVGAVAARLGGAAELGLHLHDTRGMALANAVAGLDAGVRRFDASVGGLGGCPFSPGATGNVCTEDLVHLLHALGWRTGIDLDALIAVAADVDRALEARLPSRMLAAGPRFATTAR